MSLNETVYKKTKKTWALQRKYEQCYFKRTQVLIARNPQSFPPSISSVILMYSNNNGMALH